MRKLLLITLQLLAFGLFAQSPQLINYQGVARDGNGLVLKNKNIGIRFEFRQGGVSSPTVFVEEQNRTTNSLGLFTAQIGTVNPTGMAQINWDAGALFLQIGIDTTGGTNYVNLGNPQQLVSVPYAMQAANVPASYAGNVLTVGKQSFTLSSSTATIDIQSGTNVAVTGTSPNYTISSTPSLNLSAPNTLSISGGNTVDITQTLTLNGNTLSVGPLSNSVTLPTATVTALSGVGTGISTVSTSANSFTVNTPAPTFTPSGPVTITGVYPNYTVNSSAASAQSTLTSSGIGTVTSVGTNSFNINVPAPSIAVTTSVGAAGVSSLAPNSFSINIPPSASPTISGLGAAQAGTSAANIYTVDVPLPTYNNATGAFSTGTNVITVAPTLSLTGSVLSSGPSSNSVTIPSAVTQTITGLGAAQAGTTAANVYTVDVPLPTYNNATGAFSTGTNVITVAPTLSLTGSVLSSGPSSNSVSIPSAVAQTITGLGAAQAGSVSANIFTVNVPAAGLTSSGIGTVTATGTNSYNINIPAPSIAITTSVGAAGVSSLAPNSFSINIPPSASPTISGLGAAQAGTTAANVYTVDVPLPTYNNATGAFNTGTNVITVAPTLSLTGSVLSSGPSSNSVTIPSAVTQTITGLGAAQAGTTAANVYTVDVPLPTYNNATGAFSTGTNVITVAPTLSLTGSVLSSGPSSNSVTIPSAVTQTITGLGAAQAGTTAANVYTVDVPLPTYNNATGAFNTGTNVITVAPTLSLTGSVLSSGPSSNSVTIPSAVTQTITGLGAAQAGTTAANVYTVDVPLPTYNNATGAFNTGTNVITVAPTLSLTGSVLSSGPSSNSVTIPSAVTQTITGLGAAQAGTTAANVYTVDVPLPTYNNATGAFSTGTNVITVAPTLSLTGSVLSSGPSSNSVTIPSAVTQTITGLGAAQAGTTAANVYTVDVPLPTYNNATGAFNTGTNVITVAPTLSLTGSVLSSGPSSNSVTIPSAVTQTITGLGAAQAGTTAANVYTVDVPLPTYNNATGAFSTGTNVITVAPTLSLTGSVLSSGPSSNSVTIPSAVTQTITGLGAAQAGTTAANVYTVDVPLPTYNNATGAFNTGTNVITVAPTLSLTGNILTSGPLSNSVSIPSAVAQTITGLGAAQAGSVSANIFTVNVPAAGLTSSGIGTVTATGTNSYNINIPAPSIAITTSVGAAGVSSLAPNSFSINIPPSASPTISGLGAAQAGTSAANVYTVDVPLPTYNNATGAFSTGTNVITVAPTLSLTGSVLSSGPTSNSVSIPSAVAQTITGLGAAQAGSVSANIFTVNVPAAGLTSSGIGTVTATGTNSYNINIPAPSIAVTTSVGAAGVSSLAPNSFSINIPPSASPTITGLGAAQAGTSAANVYTVDVPLPTYNNATGAFNTGTNVITVAPTLSLTGNILTSGPLSNSVSIPSAVAQTITGLGAAQAGSVSANIFTVNVPAAGLTSSGIGTVTATGTNSYNINIPAPSIAITTSVGAAGVSSLAPNSFSINIPPSASPTISGLGAAQAGTTAANVYTVDVPLPTYNNATGAFNTGTNVITVAPTLSLTGNILTSGPLSNSITIPTSPTYTSGTGIAITSGSIINTAPNQSVTILQGGIVSVGGSYPSFSVSANPPAISGTGVASVTSAANTFTVNVPDPVISYNSGTLTVTQGTASSSATIPITPNPTITGLGVAVVSPTTGNNFVVTVSDPTLTSNGNSITIAQGTVSSTATLSIPNYSAGAGIAITSNSIVNTAPDQTVTIVQGGIVSVAGGYPSFSVSANPPAMLGTGLASVTSAANTFTVNVPDPVLSINAGTLTVTQGTASSNVTLPIAPSPTITGAGIAVVSPTTGNNFTVTVNQPTFAYSQSNGSLTSGSSSANITPNLTYSNGVITSGPASNSVAINSGTNAMWSTLGNASTTPSINFIGTTDNTALNFKVNNQKAGTIDPDGSTFIGYQAGAVNTSTNNTGFGYQSLLANTTGTGNTGFGFQTLSANIGGSANTAIGQIALISNTSGHSNIAIGYQALRQNLTGHSNSALGAHALYANNSGLRNSAVGVDALYAATGSSNTAIGFQSGYLNSSGVRNVFIGNQSGYFETGSDKLYISNSTTSVSPLIYGDFASGRVGINTNTVTEALDVLGNVKFSGALMPAGAAGTAGQILTSSGAGVAPTWQNATGQNWGLAGNTVGASTTFIGTLDNYALNIRVNNQISGQIDPALSNSFFGYQSGLAIPTGNQNSGFGALTLFTNTSGIQNAAFGVNALAFNSSGSRNTAVGVQALYSNTTGSNNVATGYQALQSNTTGSLNVANGYQALFGNNAGVENIASGSGAMFANTSGNANTAYGSYALGTNNSGSSNVAIGYRALNSNSTGSTNVAIGRNAGFSNVNGNSNVFVGQEAGFYETGSNKLYIANSTTSTTPLIYGDFASGKLSINTTTNTQALNVGGNVNFSGALMPNDLAGTAGQYLVSAGTGLPPVWASPGTGTNTAWGTLGNAGTTSSNFIGTSDAQPLSIRTNSVERIKIASTGEIGIGITAPTAPIDFGNLGGVNKMISLYGSTSADNYQYYGFGISANTLRYHVNGAAQQHVFYAGTSATTANELMRISGNGRVGIGNQGGVSAILTVSVAATNSIDPAALNVTSNYTGTATKYGIDVNIDGAGSGTKFGINSSVIGLASDASPIVGYYSNMVPNGSGANYAYYNVTSSAGSGPGYGLYSIITSSVGNTSTICGVYNSLNKPTGSSGIPYGTFNSVINNGSSVGYNYYGSNTGTAATRYGIYMNGETDNYFSSNTGIGTTPGTSRLFVYTPATDGTSPIGITATNNYTGTATKYGIDVNVDGSGSGTKYGISSSVVGLALDASAIYGYQVSMTPNGDGSSYGIYSNQSSVGNGARFGIYNLVYATSTNTNVNYGMYNYSSKASGATNTNYGLYTYATGGGNTYGIYASCPATIGDYAGYFAYDVHVAGTLSKSGGSFKIDHPQDPENKYLIHSFVESPDMMNVYNGNITTNSNGEAVVNLPSYFEAENINFKYQLTVIGQFAQAIVYEEVSNNQFTIKTDKPNVKVSWQVTGVRNDEYAKQHRIVPEVEKQAKDKGKYLNPDLFGYGNEKAIHPKPEDPTPSNQPELDNSGDSVPQVPPAATEPENHQPLEENEQR